MELYDAEPASHRAQQVLQHFPETGQPVVHVRHVATDDGVTFFLPDTLGVAIHELVTPLSAEPVITKHTPNSFHETNLKSMLAPSVKRFVIAGMMTHMCVDSTVRAASDSGFDCVVAGDACATRDQSYGGRTVKALDVHAAFLAALSGTFARVRSASEVVTGALD